MGDGFLLPFGLLLSSLRVRLGLGWLAVSRFVFFFFGLEFFFFWLGGFFWAVELDLIAEAT